MYIYTYIWICVYVGSFHLNEKIYTIYRKKFCDSPQLWERNFTVACIVKLMFYVCSAEESLRFLILGIGISYERPNW